MMVTYFLMKLFYFVWYYLMLILKLMQWHKFKIHKFVPNEISQFHCSQWNLCVCMELSIGDNLWLSLSSQIPLSPIPIQGTLQECIS